MSKGRRYRDYDEDPIERKARRVREQNEDCDWKFDPRKNYLDENDEEDEFDQAENWRGYHSG